MLLYSSASITFQEESFATEFGHLVVPVVVASFKGAMKMKYKFGPSQRLLYPDNSYANCRKLRTDEQMKHARLYLSMSSQNCLREASMTSQNCVFVTSR